MRPTAAIVQRTESPRLGCLHIARVVARGRAIVEEYLLSECVMLHEVFAVPPTRQLLL